MCCDNFFELLDLGLIMSLDDQPQAFFQVLQVSHADGFPHQSRHAVSPLVVQAFNNAGFSAAFAARPVLPGGKQLGIRLVKVGVDQLL
jgi:hypothetical protein